MMTHTPNTHGDALLDGAHRAIRVLDAGEGPFAGVLVTDGASLVVRRDAEAMRGWEGWRFSGSEHVLGPCDAVRRAEGHDMLLPWCSEHVGAFIGRRRMNDRPLSPGECSTVVVSLLRALGELGANECSDIEGAWWLTHDGRPVFVIGEGERARRGVAALIAGLEEQSRDRTLGRLLSALHTGLVQSIAEQGSLPALLLQRWEKEMLEIAAPRALERDEPVSAPTAVSVRPAASDRWQRTARDARSRQSTTEPRTTTRSPLGVVVTIRSLVGLGVRRARAVARTADRRRPDSSSGGRAAASRVGPAPAVATARTGRRRPLILAAAAAAVVLTVGVLWPNGDDHGTAGTRTEPTPVRSEDSTSGLPAVPSADEGTILREGEPADAVDGALDDPVAAAAALWGALVGCHEKGDDACDGTVLPGAVGATAAMSEVGKASPMFTAVDRYGDIAVVRASAAVTDDAAGTDAQARAAHILVLVLLNEKWLVRDVYDVADQPG